MDSPLLNPTLPLPLPPNNLLQSLIMKQILKFIHPKKLFKSNSTKSRSISKSSPPSFGSSSTTTTTSSTTTSSLSSFKFDVVSAFRMIDRDGNGKIDRNELKSLFNKSLTDSELNEMIKDIDQDGDGCISLDELQAVGSVFESTAREEEDELVSAFEYFDTDHDGKISAVELFDGLSKLGDIRCSLEDCYRMILSVDVNQDGFVCFQDFSRMMEVIPR